MLRGGSLKKFCLLIGFLVLGSWPAAAQTAVRVNCGGNAYTDAKAQVWRADGGYSGGVVSNITATVAGTTDQSLYQNGRYTSNLTTPLVYSFPVAAGSYHLNFYFSETFGGAPKIRGRVFQVKMEGNAVFQHPYIYPPAGANT